MIRFKQFLAFPMLLTAGWLVWIAARQAGWVFDFTWVIGLVVLGLIAWSVVALRSVKASAFGSGLLLIVVGQSFYQASQPQIQWLNYSPEVLAQQTRTDRPVLVNMTADWCISCLANEQLVFASADMADLDVVWIKGDWTEYDPQITTYLNQFNRVGVPLYVVYRPGRMPQVLPQVLTKAMVTDALLSD